MRRAYFFKTVFVFLVAVMVAPASDTAGRWKQADGVRNVRYCEIIVAERHGLSGTADVYNTLGFSDCPQAKWSAMDPARLKKETGAAAVVLNGPRRFVMDEIAAFEETSAVRDFDGLRASLVARIELTRSAAKRQPYTETAVERRSKYVYKAGSDVYQLTSPNGRLYIMQSYSQEADRNLDESALADLCNRLKVPYGWRFEVHRLQSDLIVQNKGSKAYVIQDELLNTYQRIQ